MKPIFKSKTAIAGVVTILAGLWPPAQLVVTAHPEIALTVIGGLNIALRWVTRKRVTLY